MRGKYDGTYFVLGVINKHNEIIVVIVIELIVFRRKEVIQELVDD